MSLQRWDPFSEMMTLRDAMNRLFEESFVRPGSGVPAAAGQFTAAVDLREQGDNFILEATLPGVKPEDVDVSVLGNQVTIQGEIKSETEKKEERYHLRERRRGRFQRTIALPTTVQADQAQCDFNDGVLRITLPKAEEAKPRRIPVMGGQPKIEGRAATQGAHQAGGGQSEAQGG